MQIPITTENNKLVDLISKIYGITMIEFTKIHKAGGPSGGLWKYFITLLHNLGTRITSYNRTSCVLYGQKSRLVEISDLIQSDLI